MSTVASRQPHFLMELAVTCLAHASETREVELSNCSNSSPNVKTGTVPPTTSTAPLPTSFNMMPGFVGTTMPTYRDLEQSEISVRVGMEATGLILYHSRSIFNAVNSRSRSATRLWNRGSSRKFLRQGSILKKRQQGLPVSTLRSSQAIALSISPRTA